MEIENFPKYNFHSHTYRCGHAAMTDDYCYLNEAVERGYVKYGFTDHVPVHPIFYSDTLVRMHDNQTDEYLNEIERLKEIYTSIIDVYSGFEAEYDEIIEKYLCNLKERCDYMILGQHYILNKYIRTTPEYPLEYAKKVCSAIESGIFDIVAHPDIFMQYRFSMKSREDRDKFQANGLIASRMICEKAKEYGVVLELNLGGTYVNKLENVLDGYNDSFFEKTNIDLENSARYPTRLFWEIASEVGNDAVVGIDAHSLEEIGLRERKLKKISQYIDLDKIKFLPLDYDPVIARENNLKLLEAYEKTKAQLTSVEGKLVSYFVDELVVNSKKVRKFNIQTELIRKLREKPHHKTTTDNNFTRDNLTFKKRQELIDIIKCSINKMSSLESMDMNKFRGVLIGDIDKYYDSKKGITKLKNM